MSSPLPTKPKPSIKDQLGLNYHKLIGGALAAVTAAVAASFFGIAGTLVGAGLGSIIITVGTAIYEVSLRSTNERLRQAVPLSTLLRRVRWPAVAAVSALVFALGMGVVFGVEVTGGGSLSSLLHGRPDGGTSVGGGAPAPSRPTSTPSPSIRRSYRPTPSLSPTSIPSPSLILTPSPSLTLTPSPSEVPPVSAAPSGPESPGVPASDSGP